MATVSIIYAGFTPAPPYSDAAALTAVDTAALSLYAGFRAYVSDLGVYKLIPNDTNTANGTTYIAATPNGNWVLDLTPYICLDSNNVIASEQLSSIDKLANGTAAAPSLAFASNPTLGIYRVSADVLGIASVGALVVSVGSTAVTVATGAQIVAPAATAAAPAYTFAGDLDTGMYHVSANVLGLAAGGTLSLSISTTAVTSALPIVAPAGTAAAPGLTLGSEQSGLYLVGAGSLGLSVAGAIKTNLTATALNMATGVALQIATIQVVGPRNTGWTTSSGTGTKNQAALNVDTITATDANIRLIGQWLKGATDALILHGLIGT